VNRRQRETLRAIRERPTRSDIRWSAAESLLESLGASMTQGRGSRVRVKLGNRRMVLHRPHPEPELKKGSVESLRDFLNEVRD
jgi:hypothetical protein